MPGALESGMEAVDSGGDRSHIGANIRYQLVPHEEIRIPDFEDRLNSEAQSRKSAWLHHLRSYPPKINVYIIASSGFAILLVWYWAVL